MKVEGKHYRTIWLKEGDDQVVQIIDQRSLPHKFVIEEVRTVVEMTRAIRDMHVRGAGLIGAAAGYGMYLATLEAAHHSSFSTFINHAANNLMGARPTAVNLEWAVGRQLSAIAIADTNSDKISVALSTAKDISDEDVRACHQIGIHGLQLIKELASRKQGQPVNILTHCNAGWLAFVDYGSATAPIYAAFDAGIPIHIWVDETRPRNQGARLTSWELGQHGVPHTIIADNTGGHLMQHRMVDLVITGTDRTTYTGDVANKIGTYLKALAAKDNNIPFYVALPSSSFDWKISDGLTGIPIEQRSPDEVKYIQGYTEGALKDVLLTPKNSNAVNYGFDITPSRLVSGLITERGICRATEEGIRSLFPEMRNLN